VQVSTPLGLTLNQVVCEGYQPIVQLPKIDLPDYKEFSKFDFELRRNLSFKAKRTIGLPNRATAAIFISDS
jgi:hypothetical protein